MDIGLLVAGLAALPLIPLMSGSWFCLGSGSLGGEGAIAVSSGRCFDAWTSFAVVDVVLMVTAVAVIGVTLLAAFRKKLPVSPGPLMTVFGGTSFLLVAWRLVSPPFAGAGRAAAPFLALLCLAAIGGGGWLSSRLQGTPGPRSRKDGSGSGSRGGGIRPDGYPGRRGRPAAAGGGRGPVRLREFNRDGRTR